MVISHNSTGHFYSLQPDYCLLSVDFVHQNVFYTAAIIAITIEISIISMIATISGTQIPKVFQKTVYSVTENILFWIRNLKEVR